LFVDEDEGLLLADVEEGAGLAAQVAQVVALVLEDDLCVPAADGELVGVAEVVVGVPAELGPREVEHLELADLLVLLNQAVDRLVLLGSVVVEADGGAAAGVGRLLLGEGVALIEVEGVGDAADLYALQWLEVEQVERQL
jgi:hypothetical protein